MWPDAICRRKARHRLSERVSRLMLGTLPCPESSAVNGQISACQITCTWEVAFTHMHAADPECGNQLLLVAGWLQSQHVRRLPTVYTTLSLQTPLDLVQRLMALTSAASCALKALPAFTLS